MTQADETPEPAPPADVSESPRPGSDEVAEEDRVGRALTIGVALAVLASVLGPIARSGLWDPYELDVADFARRIAVTILGDDSLRLEGADNTVPILADLGRGELPFTSVAFGFRAFGLQDWAGRGALAAWGLLGIAAMHLLTRRLAGARVATFASLVLATTPIYFLHGRTILGDIVTMSAIACTLAGFGLLLLDDALEGVRARVGLAALGALGIVAGFTSRGAALGVGVPAAALGATWWLSRQGSETAVVRWRWWLAAALSALGVIGLGVGIAAALMGSEHYSELVGARVQQLRKLPTFETFVRHVGHGMFPYSAVLPVAFAALVRAPRGGEARQRRESDARLLLLATATIAFGVHAALGARVGPMPFVAVPALAVLAALALLELSAPGGWSASAVVCIAAVMVVLLLDLSSEPSRVFESYAVAEPTFPDGMTGQTKRVFRYGSLVVLLAFLLVHAEAATPGRDGRAAFSRKDFEQFPRWVWGGLRSQLGRVAAPWRRAERDGVQAPRRRRWMSRGARMLVTPLHLVGFVLLGALALVPLVLVAGALVARDAMRCVFRSPVRRGTVSVVSFAAFGLTLSLSYFPALASQISPKAVFESFREMSAEGDELAIMGGKAGGARYYVGTSVPSFSSSTQGFRWLMEPGEGTRRWLVIRDKDLARMNSMYREETSPPANLPIVNGRSSEVMLAVDRLPDGVATENPLDEWVSATPPRPAHPLDVDFNGQLHCLGWDLLDSEGKRLSEVSRGEDFKLALYFHVTSKITGSWQTFIHLDKASHRHNGDHETLGGRYPFRHWNVGDYISDVHTIRLARTLPAGTYTAYFGFYTGKTRLKVLRGPHAEDRVNGGTFTVR